MVKPIVQSPIIKKRDTEKKTKEDKVRDNIKISHRFITVLAIVSILGFVGIVSATLFSFDLSLYVEALLMFIIGIGLIIEIKLSRLKALSTEGMNKENFTNLITVIVGFVAIIAGIFSFPPIRIEIPAFLAVKGILGIIAIIIITVQTWIIDKQ